MSEPSSRLNEESVEALSPMAAEDLARFRELTAHTLVCEVDGEVAAFAIAYAPGTAYDSVNYFWHADAIRRFPLPRPDRRLDPHSADAASRPRSTTRWRTSPAERGRMVCEMNSDPPNVAYRSRSMPRAAIARSASLRLSDGHEVVMMEKLLERVSSMTPDELARRVRRRNVG